SLFRCTVGLSTISPLFPYTTLFRSSGSTRAMGAGGFDVVAGRGDAPGQLLVLLRKWQQRAPQPVADALALQQRLDRHRVGLHAQDRKSTRLNSSHVKISYAVFCLKK